MNLEKVKTIIRGKGLIIVVKIDNKAPNRKKVFNTLTKCKIKVPKLQNINSFGSVIMPLFYLPMATNIPSKWSQFPSYEDIMPKPSHTPLFSETAENLQGTELWGRKRGNRLVWREKGDSTHAEQVSGRELFAGSLWYESYPCTCYMRLSTLVQSQINRQFSDPEHSQGKRNKQKTREAEARKDGVATGRSQKPGNISFADGEMRSRGVSVWTKDTQLMAVGMNSVFPSTMPKEKIRWIRNRQSQGSHCSSTVFCEECPWGLKAFPGVSWTLKNQGGLLGLFRVPVALSQRDPKKLRVRPADQDRR